MGKRRIWTEEYVRKILEIATTTNVLSLSTPIKVGSEACDEVELVDFIMDDKDGPQEIIEIAEERLLLLKYVHKLQPKEMQIIIDRYGLIDGKFKTLEEVGNHHNVTREYVRQVELAAINNLRRMLTRDGYDVNNF